MIADLDEPNPDGSALGGPLEHGAHERPSDPSILCGRINADRTDGGDRPPFVEERAADDPALALRDDPVEARVGHQAAHAAGGHPDAREIGREAVLGGERGECFVEDPAALGDVGRDGLAERQSFAGRARRPGRHPIDDRGRGHAGTVCFRADPFTASISSRSRSDV